MYNPSLNDRSRSEWLMLIGEWVHNEADRRLLERRLLDGICYEPLAEEFSLSVEQTKKRVYKAQRQLFKHV